MIDSPVLAGLFFYYLCFRGSLISLSFLVTALCAPAGYYPAAGYRNRTSGALNAVGTDGYAWGSTQSTATVTESVALFIRDAEVTVSGIYADYLRGYGLSVRCLQAFTSQFDLFEVEGTRRREKGTGISAVALRAFLLIAHRAIPLKSLLLSPCSLLPFFSDCFSRPDRLLSGRGVSLPPWRRRERCQHARACVVEHARWRCCF